jgi:hypothetical protein
MVPRNKPEGPAVEGVKVELYSIFTWALEEGGGGQLHTPAALLQVPGSHCT